MHEDWRELRRQQDRGRYLRFLSMKGIDRARRIGHRSGIRRHEHHLLVSPAAMTRTATNQPDPEHARNYLRHSCDLVMGGGVAAALLHPTAACALAEHYVVRRVAGSSAAGLTAAAVAAAELGRGAPDPVPLPKAPGVVPGYAGLAEAVGWLAGDDQVREARARSDPPQESQEQWRLARMLQPSVPARPLYRALTAVLLWPGGTGAQTARRLVLTALAPPGRIAKVVLGLLLLGSALCWAGLSITMAVGGQAAELPPWVAASSSAVLLVVVALAATSALLLCYALAALRRLRVQAEPELFGLVPGLAQGGRRGRATRWLDRQAGVPEPGDVPAIATWLADRLDDLAGLPAADEPEARRALTFGDLWLGSPRERTLQDAELLRRAAADPEQRTVDLQLMTVNLSQDRPYTFPLPPAEVAQRQGGTTFLFCDACLEPVLPARVVLQLVKASPATETEHGCPRHERGVLRELPDPWDVPVAVAVRMAVARPGLLAAVPLYSVEPADPTADEPGATAARPQWFVDAGPGGAPIDTFDRLLPRWPTFGLSLHPQPTGKGEVRLPGPDADGAAHRWQQVGTATGYAAAAAGRGWGWRDALHADLPGLRGRIARVRQDLAGGHAPFLPQAVILRLAAHGAAAGDLLRERFVGPDEDLIGQDGTDRYRWVRMRLALRHYRAMSSELGARLPLFTDLAASYRVPESLTGWYAVQPAAGSPDPGWTDAATVITTLRAMGTGGVLDFDADDGAAPVQQQLRLDPQA